MPRSSLVSGPEQQWRVLTTHDGGTEKHTKVTGAEYIASSAHIGTMYAAQTNKTKKNLRGLSPQANYTERTTAACRRN
jgi:hypothetical protein